MKYYILLSLLLAFTTSYGENLPYIDDQFQCASENEAQSLARDFNVDVNSFGGMELCNSQTDFKKLYNDLIIIKNGRFNASENNLYIKNFIPADRYYDWMKSMTRGMRRGNDVPAATAYNSSGYFTMQDGWTKLSTLGRVGTVLHEARHTESFYHIPCTHGPYMNSTMQGCDRDYSYGGSHAIEMEYYARVSVMGENFHPVYKTMARLMAVARSNFVFNLSPIQTREALFAIDKNTHQGFLVDGNTVYPREVPSQEGSLKRTSFGAAVFSNLKAYAIEMYEKTGFQPVLLDTYSYFKLLLSFPRAVKDFEEFDVNTKRFAVGLTQDNKIISYNFPAGSWGADVSLNFKAIQAVTTLPNGQKGYFLIDNQQSIHQLDPFTLQTSETKEKWANDLVSVALRGQSIYLLKDNGRIYEKTSSSEERESHLFPAGNYSGLISVPLYSGFEVKL